MAAASAVPRARRLAEVAKVPSAAFTIPSSSIREAASGLKTSAIPIAIDRAFGSQANLEEMEARVETLVIHVRHVQPDGIQIVAHNDHLAL